MDNPNQYTILESFIGFNSLKSHIEKQENKEELFHILKKIDIGYNESKYLNLALKSKVDELKIFAANKSAETNFANQTKSNIIATNNKLTEDNKKMKSKIVNLEISNNHLEDKCLDLSRIIESSLKSHNRERSRSPKHERSRSPKRDRHHNSTSRHSHRHRRSRSPKQEKTISYCYNTIDIVSNLANCEESEIVQLKLSSQLYNDIFTNHDSYVEYCCNISRDLYKYTNKRSYISLNRSHDSDNTKIILADWINHKQKF